MLTQAVVACYIRSVDHALPYTFVPCVAPRVGLAHRLDDEDVVQLVKKKVKTGEEGKGRYGVCEWVCGCVWVWGCGCGWVGWCGGGGVGV